MKSNALTTTHALIEILLLIMFADSTTTFINQMEFSKSALQLKTLNILLQIRAFLDMGP